MCRKGIPHGCNLSSRARRCCGDDRSGRPLSGRSSAHPAPAPILHNDGQNNLTGRHHADPQGMLEETGRFAVRSPPRRPRRAAASDTATRPIRAWDPSGPISPNTMRFQQYNGDDWPSEVCADSNATWPGGRPGGFPRANNPFPTCKLERNCRTRLASPPSRPHNDRRLHRGQIRTPGAKAPARAHGPRQPYEDRLRDAGHPIPGDPERWLHVSDELYHGQRGRGATSTSWPRLTPIRRRKAPAPMTDCQYGQLLPGALSLNLMATPPNKPPRPTWPPSYAAPMGRTGAETLPLTRAFK
jgi:hypothetical protein